MENKDEILHVIIIDYEEEKNIISLLVIYNDDNISIEKRKELINKWFDDKEYYYEITCDDELENIKDEQIEKLFSNNINIVICDEVVKNAKENMSFFQIIL